MPERHQREWLFSFLLILTLPVCARGCPKGINVNNLLEYVETRPAAKNKNGTTERVEYFTDQTTKNDEQGMMNNEVKVI